MLSPVQASCLERARPVAVAPYRTDHHLAVAQGQATPDRDPREVVAAHVRRLEALRRAGIVEREADGVWRVPGDLAEQGRQYDAQRLAGGVAGGAEIAPADRAAGPCDRRHLARSAVDWRR